MNAARVLVPTFNVKHADILRAYIVVKKIMKLDVVQMLWGMVRRCVPIDAVKDKLQEYVSAKLLPDTEATEMSTVFEQMRGIWSESNGLSESSDNSLSQQARNIERELPLSQEELRDELHRREQLLQQQDASTVNSGSPTDQWRVYSEAVAKLTASTEPERLFVQASAGTGKSFCWKHVSFGVF